MKSITIFTILLAGLIVSGCKKTTNIIITPENAGDVVVVNSDNGELADFFDAVPNTYEVVSVNDTLQVELAFVVNKNVKEYQHGEFESFVLIPLNSENNAIGEVVFNACDANKMNEALFNAVEGTNVSVKFQYVPVSEKEKDMLIKEMSFCRVELKLSEMVVEEEGDDYDKMMDSYVEACVSNNEEVMHALIEDLAMCQFEGEFTPEQEKRWQNIDAEIEQKKAGK